MWDNARALNAIADALLLGAVAVALWYGAQAVMRSATLPLRTVAIAGNVQYLDRESVAAQLDGRIANNFFGVELNDVKKRLEALPWVRRATVRRKWPDRLLVDIEEHRPLAHWSDGRLVNTYGELFEGESDAVLPRFGGPIGMEREVTRRYRAFCDSLAPLGTEPVEVLLSVRFAWQIKLSNGIVLELGRDDGRESLEARVERFVAAFPRVVAQLNRRLEHVDLRYPNGFAIRMPDRGNRAENTMARKRT
jgi:cell division protein FtsQ